MARIINAGSDAVAYECVPRPNCPACGAEWDDEMVALFDIALGLGCSCCNPFAADLPDIVCHKCKKVLYTTRQSAPPPETPAPGELDMTPRD
jgi:hypothetical protein